jgi:hypothetical protein
MINLIIEGTNNTPSIKLDADNQILTVSGRSLPENAPVFYASIFDWVKEYLDTSNKEKETIFEFKLEYFNTSSSKVIYELLKLLAQLPLLEVRWYYETDDEDLLEAGEEFSELISAKFSFIETN